MRKYSVAVLIVLMILNMSVFAGSIPEDLKGDDNALLYFGEVIRYDPKYGEDGYIELAVKKIIKGDVTGKRQSYTDVLTIGQFEIVVGAEYLIGYFDENNPVYIMETTTQEPRTLKIKHIYSDDMFERLEHYLNSGEVEEAETARLAKKKQPKSEPVMAKNPEAKRNNKMPYYIAIGVALAVVFGGVALKGKSKNGKNRNTED